MQNKGLLGGLLLLLPQRSGENGSDGDDSDENATKALAELEQWLVHNTFQVCCAILAKAVRGSSC